MLITVVGNSDQTNVNDEGANSTSSTLSSPPWVWEERSGRSQPVIQTRLESLTSIIFLF